MLYNCILLAWSLNYKIEGSKSCQVKAVSPSISHRFSNAQK